MTHNPKRNRRDTTTQDGDDYVYPTKKGREYKIRNRKHDKNLIKAGLVDYENLEEDSFVDEEYNGESMSQSIEEEVAMAEYNDFLNGEDIIKNSFDNYHFPYGYDNDLEEL